MDESGKPKYIHQHNSPTSPLQPTRRAGFSSVKLTSPDGTGGRLNGSVGLFAGKAEKESGAEDFLWFLVCRLSPGDAACPSGGDFE
jgi:hypothetical protein